jgi:hypothetical protein
MAEFKPVFEEENVISLRTAFVFDDGNLVNFRLMQAAETSIPATKRRSPSVESCLKDAVWLYRHLRSESEETELVTGLPRIEQDIRPIRMSTPPRFHFVWSDSGHSVALFLNGEPWAFIDEVGHTGYSKGILKADVGRPWDQLLFERIFGIR